MRLPNAEGDVVTEGAETLGDFAFIGGKKLTRCLDAARKGGRLAHPNGIEPEPRRRRGLKVIPYDATP